MVINKKNVDQRNNLLKKGITRLIFNSPHISGFQANFKIYSAGFCLHFWKSDFTSNRNNRLALQGVRRNPLVYCSGLTTGHAVTHNCRHRSVSQTII
ncbi:hypothetical protein C7G83_07645 [Siccibacter turicensis]|uniref:Uncharacterized protein n=1 Tax=Siccibacter turicensis TaxID=357233 RepID=A0A2P8VKR6_9ENTR|nr:hypothetical protein C7G83_07645 [Siccibacter turicensis]